MHTALWLWSDVAFRTHSRGWMKQAIFSLLVRSWIIWLFVIFRSSSWNGRFTACCKACWKRHRQAKKSLVSDVTYTSCLLSIWTATQSEFKLFLTMKLCLMICFNSQTLIQSHSMIHHTGRTAPLSILYSVKDVGAEGFLFTRLSSNFSIPP